VNRHLVHTSRPHETRTTTHLEAGDTLNNRSDNVKLLLGSLVVVSLPLESDSDSAGWGFDTSGPDGLVESWGDTDVLDTHRLLGKLDNGLDGFWCLCIVSLVQVGL
jgi:hypothetical protein